ncbi:MAG: hypothetical protein IIZ78_08845 [Clostridiales bacterium]|nr:hypothetical protein [Clostridiales bacterium]
MKFLHRKKKSIPKPLEIPMPKVIPPKTESSEFLVILKAELNISVKDMERVRLHVIEQMKQGNVIMIPCGIGIEVVMLNGKNDLGVKVVTEGELKEKYSEKEKKENE